MENYGKEEIGVCLSGEGKNKGERIIIDKVQSLTEIDVTVRVSIQKFRNGLLCYID